MDSNSKYNTIYSIAHCILSKKARLTLENSSFHSNLMLKHKQLIFSTFPTDRYNNLGKGNSVFFTIHSLIYQDEPKQADYMAL